MYISEGKIIDNMLQVAIPPPSMDFDFNDAQPLPFLSAPPTPKHFEDFSLSAPSSPSRPAEFYPRFDDFQENSRGGGIRDEGDVFAFDFRSELEEASLSADELFDGGKIKPLIKPNHEHTMPGKKILAEDFSPFFENSRDERGRERGQSAALTSNKSRRSARSLSPYRVSEYPWEDEEERGRKLQGNSKQAAITADNSVTSKTCSRRWRLKDLFLFRSASEGRASDKGKYPSLFRKPQDHGNNSSSFRYSSDSTGSAPAKRKGQLSAHELHYKTNKAASQDLKKKTYLPYKRGILGRF